jgi:hypothetical protein
VKIFRKLLENPANFGENKAFLTLSTILKGQKIITMALKSEIIGTG